jgi:hypothetical protein
MEIETKYSIQPANQSKYFRIALGLAVFMILYNIAEGLVSMYFGYEDETLALFI